MEWCVEQILIIDDEQATLIILRKMLEAEGYRVLDALDGQEGLELFRQNDVDLVITDMVMPVKDGLKTIMELMEESPATPVIAISGGGVIAKERYLAVAGCLGDVLTIPKPFERQTLVAAVKQLLDNAGGDSSPQQEL